MLLGFVTVMTACSLFASWSFNPETYIAVETDENGAVKWEIACSDYGSATDDGTEITIGKGEANDAYISGSGVLDLSGFQSDTGKKIMRFQNYAFMQNNNITHVICPTAVTISKEAFCQCKSLVSVSFQGVIQFGNDVFYQCTALEGALSFENCTTLNMGTFRDCSKITSLNLPNCVSIRDHAMRGCSELTTLVLSPNLTRLGNQCLRDCNKLTSLTPTVFPKYKISNGETHAFYNTPALQGDFSFPNLQKISDCFFCGTGMNSVSAPNAVTVSRMAFDSSAVKSVVLSSQLTSIGYQAFNNAAKLESLSPYLPESLVAMDYEAFKGCVSLKAPPALAAAGLTEIAYGTFEGTAANFTDALNIYSPIASIGNSAFKGGKNGQVYNFYADVAPGLIGTDAFAGPAETDMAKICVHNPKALDGWKNLCAPHNDAYATLKSREDFPGVRTLGVIGCETGTAGTYTYHWVVNMSPTGGSVVLLF